MASRYSLGTLLAIVIPISAVLLLSLLLLLIFCCCFFKQKSHIRQLNKQVSFNAQNERYNLRKKNPSSGVDHPDKTKLKVPWYQKILYCGCCSADVSHKEASPSAQEKGLHAKQGNSRANDVSRHNSQKKAANGAPQKHEGRHEMKFLSGQYDDPNNSQPAKKSTHASGPAQPSQYKGDPRGSTHDHSYSGSAHPSRYSHGASTNKATAPDAQDNAKYKNKSSRASSGAEGLEYGTPKEYSVPASKRDNNTSGSPQDILPPAPLNLNSQGIILTDEDTNQSIDEPKYFEKYQTEALERDQRTRQSANSHERDLLPREVLSRDQMGRHAISRQDSVQNSSIYPASSTKSPVAPHGDEGEDRFVNGYQQRNGQGSYELNDRETDANTPTLTLGDANRNSTQYKWLDPPINLARVHRGENKLSMVASFVEPLTPVSPVDHTDQDRLDQYGTPEDRGTPGVNQSTGTSYSLSHQQGPTSGVPSASYTSSPLNNEDNYMRSQGSGHQVPAQSSKYTQNSFAQSESNYTPDSRSRAATTAGLETSSSSRTQNVTNQQDVQASHYSHNKRPSFSNNTQQAPAHASVHASNTRGSYAQDNSVKTPYAGAVPTTSSQTQPTSVSPNALNSSVASSTHHQKYPKNQSSLMSVDGGSQYGDNSEFTHSPNIVDQSPHWKPSPVATSSRHQESPVMTNSSSPAKSGDNYYPIPRQAKARDERKPASIQDTIDNGAPKVPHGAESTTSRNKTRNQHQSGTSSDVGSSSRKSRGDRSNDRSRDYSREEPTASYGSEWHRNRPDTESSVESEYTHGTYATAPSRAPSRAPYDSSREKEPMIPVHNGERPLETPWRTRRSQSTSSRASSLLFSVSEKGHISSGSHRKKGSISSSTRTKHKDPSKLNKPLPKTPPGGGKDMQDFPDNATYDTNDTNSPMVSQAGSGPISLSSKAYQGPQASQSQTQATKSEDGVVANMGGMLFHAVFPYQPALEDELPLTPREVVKVYQVFDDGWCFARKENPTSGPAHGICPKVCLANISE